MTHSTTTPPQVDVMYAGNGYFVTITTGDSLRVANEQLLTKPEAQTLAAQVRKQIALEAAAQAAPNNRCGRAMQLVASGAVRKNGNGYEVHSQNEAKLYHTTAHHCDCPDAQYNKPAGGCKHQLAVRMSERMGEFDELLDEVRSKPAVYLTDQDLAVAECEPMYTDWRS